MRLSRIVLLTVAVVACLGVLLAVAVFALGPAAIGGNDTINTVIGYEPPSLEDKGYGGERNDLLVATDTSPDVID
jgi:hypothetical protein